MATIKPSRKTYQNTQGRWVEKRTVTEILVCTCGGKYIKTRPEQVICVRCQFGTK